ncbi:hypothetical protein CN135_25835 [Sinorhizobium meliloti]|uniref:hypothetical protein n=1 Tax=Rhizobium meliloti TaxID=382 RepID=UPI000FD6D558|nr:hypothetical protein [Sinorhizobium meliloti]RVL74860.1 hypothetical protein CN135_25835 [Sinorhizobium meliloti]
MATKNKKIEVSDEVINQGTNFKGERGWNRFILDTRLRVSDHRPTGAFEQIMKAGREPKPRLCPQGAVGKYGTLRETIGFLPTNSAMFSMAMALPPGPPLIFSM